MAIESVHCAVLNGAVTRITNLEGQTTRLICPELLNSSGLCRRRIRAGEGGPLSQLLSHVSEHDLQLRGYGCVLSGVKQPPAS
jgi:hypothetical protein